MAGSTASCTSTARPRVAKAPLLLASAARCWPLRLRSLFWLERPSAAALLPSGRAWRAAAQRGA
eukprot:269297-Pyramimonas_sp.AAC.1